MDEVPDDVVAEFASELEQEAEQWANAATDELAKSDDYMTDGDRAAQDDDKEPTP